MSGLDNRNNYATSGGNDNALDDPNYDPFDLPAEQEAAKRDRSAFFQTQDSRKDQGQAKQQSAVAVQSVKTPQVMMAPEFEILNLRRHQGSGPTRAFFSVAVHFSRRNSKATGGDPLLLNDCRLVENREGEPFIATAQREWTDNQGQRKYSPIFELPKKWKRVLLDAVVDEAGGWPL